MITTIAKKELLISFKTVRFVVALLICCVLMPLSAWVLSSDYLRDMEDYNSRVTLEQRRTEGKNFSVNVNQPIPTLAPMFRGVSPESVKSIELRFYFGMNMGNAATTQSITHDIFPSVDLGFIIGIVLSAMALMLSFDALSGEKADATLRLIMSNSVARWKVLVGKWVGLSAALIIPFIIGLIISLLIFFMVAGINFAGGEWAAMGLITLASLLYIALFIMIGIVVSSFTTSPSASIFICLGVWGLLIIVFPQMAHAVSDELSPIDTRQTVEKNIRVKFNELYNYIRKENMELAERARRENMEYSQVNLLRNQTELMSAVDMLTDVGQLERGYWNTIEAQENTGKAVSYISPYGALSQVLISMANTGPAGQRNFLKQAYGFSEGYFEYLWTEALKEDTTWEGIFSIAPVFEYNDVEFAERFEGAMIPFTVLILMNTILLTFAVIGFNRYDVR